MSNVVADVAMSRHISTRINILNVNRILSMTSLSTGMSHPFTAMSTCQLVNNIYEQSDPLRFWFSPRRVAPFWRFFSSRKSSLRPLSGPIRTQSLGHCFQPVSAQAAAHFDLQWSRLPTLYIFCLIHSRINSSLRKHCANSCAIQRRHSGTIGRNTVVLGPAAFEKGSTPTFQCIQSSTQFSHFRQT